MINLLFTLAFFLSLIPAALAEPVRFFAVFSDDSFRTINTPAIKSEILETTQKSFALLFDSDSSEEEDNFYSKKPWTIQEFRYVDISGICRENGQGEQIYRELFCDIEYKKRTLKWYHSLSESWMKKTFTPWSEPDSLFTNNSPFHDFKYFIDNDIKQPAIVFFIRTCRNQYALFTDNDEVYKAPKTILKSNFEGELQVERVFVIDLAERE